MCVCVTFKKVIEVYIQCVYIYIYIYRHMHHTHTNTKRNTYNSSHILTQAQGLHK